MQEGTDELLGAAPARGGSAGRRIVSPTRLLQAHFGAGKGSGPPPRTIACLLQRGVRPAAGIELELQCSVLFDDCPVTFERRTFSNASSRPKLDVPHIGWAGMISKDPRLDQPFLFRHRAGR